MQSNLKSENGRTLIECFYDPEYLNWDEAIQAAYALHGLRPGQVTVIARPKHTKIMGIKGVDTRRFQS